MVDNRKTRYTKKVIRESFLELLSQKPIVKITIKELCDLADINRGTFYLHYQDINALYQEIEEEVYTNLKEILTYDPERTEREVIEALADNIRENRDLYSILGKSVQSQTFDKRLLYLHHEMPKKFSGKYNEQTVRYIFAVGYSILAVWTKGGCTEPKEKIVDCILDMIEVVREKMA